MREVSCGATIFRLEHEVFRQVPPKFVAESRHGASAETFSDTGYCNVLRDAINSTITDLCTRGFGPAGPTRGVGLTQAHASLVVWGWLGRNPVFGAGPRPSPHLTSAPSQPLQLGCLPPSLSKGRTLKNTNEGGARLLLRARDERTKPNCQIGTRTVSCGVT